MAITTVHPLKPAPYVELSTGYGATLQLSEGSENLLCVTVEGVGDTVRFLVKLNELRDALDHVEDLRYAEEDD